MSMPRRIAPFVLIAFATLPFSSCTCGSNSEPAPPKLATRAPGGFGSVTSRRPPDAPDSGLITPQAVETQPMPTISITPVSQSQIPDSFPKDVPIFDGAEVKTVQEMANKSNNVVFEVDADRAQVFKFYKDSMKKNGWKSEQEYDGKEQSFLSFKKDKTVTNVSVSTDPKTGKKFIAVMYYNEEPLPFPEF